MKKYDAIKEQVASLQDELVVLEHEQESLFEEGSSLFYLIKEEEEKASLNSLNPNSKHKLKDLEQRRKQIRESVLENQQKQNQIRLQIYNLKAPLLIEEGKKHIHPAKHKSWEKYIVNGGTIKNMAMGQDFIVTDVIKIMEMADRGDSLEEISEFFYQQDDLFQLGIFTLIEYYKRGPELIEQIVPQDKLPDNVKTFIQQMKSENAILAKKHSGDDGWNND